MLRLTGLSCALAATLVLAGCSGMGTRSTTASTAPATAQSYAVDPGHTSLVFKISHLGASDFFGRFNNVSGDLRFSENDLANSSVRIVAEAASVDTNSKDRDGHVTSPELFNAATHPQIVFSGSTFQKSGRDKYKVSGELTFHGVTKPLEVVAHKIGTVSHERFGDRIGFTSTFTISRADFNMGAAMPTSVLGDEVEITIGVEGVLQK